jgi:hypothetical protein
VSHQGDAGEPNENPAEDTAEDKSSPISHQRNFAIQEYAEPAN